MECGGVRWVWVDCSEDGMRGSEVGVGGWTAVRMECGGVRWVWVDCSEDGMRGSEVGVGWVKVKENGIDWCNVSSSSNSGVLCKGCHFNDRTPVGVSRGISFCVSRN
ncbi:hypothetical protein ACH3XW_26315 [Acanthocheilonema viteae]